MNIFFGKGGFGVPVANLLFAPSTPAFALPARPAPHIRSRLAPWHLPVAAPEAITLIREFTWGTPCHIHSQNTLDVSRASLGVFQIPPMSSFLSVTLWCYLNLLYIDFFGKGGFEPPISWSRTKRISHYPTSRKVFVYFDYRERTLLGQLSYRMYAVQDVYCACGERLFRVLF